MKRNFLLLLPLLFVMQCHRNVAVPDATPPTASAQVRVESLQSSLVIRMDCAGKMISQSAEKPQKIEPKTPIAISGLEAIHPYDVPE